MKRSRLPMIPAPHLVLFRGCFRAFVSCVLDLNVGFWAWRLEDVGIEHHESPLAASFNSWLTLGVVVFSCKGLVWEGMV